MNRTVAHLFRINPRFLRSTHLERDFSNPDSCAGYIPTDFTRTCLKRLAEGLATNSTNRAWRLTGDYGTGKSSFALVLAHLFSGQQNRPLEKLRKSVNIDDFGFENQSLVPILVTGNRLPLSLALQSALRKSLATGNDVSYTKLPSKLQHFAKVLDKDTPLQLEFRPAEGEIPGIGDQEIVDALILYSEFIKSESKGSGVLLILDELGKFLEYAAMYPERQDIYLLQQLAEAASRSGETPFFVLGLLHQGFSAYTDRLDTTSKQEWEKVSGRFEEILFNQPLDQVVLLLSSALGVRKNGVSVTHQEETAAQMTFALRRGWFGPAPPRKSWQNKAARLFPIDPLAVPIIVRTMHRFGQNERSLFSFLQSSEPYGLQAFSSQLPLQDARLYRIHDFYDYVRANLSHSINLSSTQTHWMTVESIVSSYVTDDILELQVLKTIGMLNLLNANDLLPTESIVVQAVAGTQDDLRSRATHTIDTLKDEKRILYDRGIAGGLCLWPHSSVDLDSAYKDAERAIGSIDKVSERIQAYLEPRPIVARRHYIETGNLRHFRIQYLTASTFAQFVPESERGDDGTIIVVLCDSPQERQQTLQTAKNSVFTNHPQVIIAVPDPLHNVADYLRDSLCWEWVGKNILELNTDPYARDEVSRQRQAALERLEKRISDLINLRDYSGKMAFNWFSERKSLPISNCKQLLKHLSDVYNRVFPQAPRIQNELINRQNLSVAAAAARLRLIGGMLERESQLNLGMPTNKRPPEMSMYLSVLKQGNIHVKAEKTWYIQEPLPDADSCHILPALRQIELVLKSKPDKKIAVSELFVELRKPPFGIRDGLIPLLLAIYIAAHRQDIAIFEDGTFVREVRRDDFLRLTKAPEYFEIQHSEIEGIRASVFDQLIKVLGIQRTSGERTSRILDVVRPLCTFVVELPEYVHNTKKLSQEAIAVRNTLMSAGEPAPLLFRDLPIACGDAPFDATESIGDSRVQDFAEKLKTYLTELRNAYTELLERLKFAIFEAFEVSGSFSQARGSLSSHADALRINVTESQLKALCGRLSDRTLSETKWIESVASFIASKPPSYWHDSDEVAFQNELSDFAERFKHVDGIYFGTEDRSARGEGIRLAITRSDGSERAAVMYPRPEEERILDDIQKQIRALMRDRPRLGLAAIARTVWDELNEGSEKTR